MLTTLTYANPIHAAAGAVSTRASIESAVGITTMGAAITSAQQITCQPPSVRASRPPSA